MSKLRLKEIMTEKDITGIELGKKIGKTAQSISNLNSPEALKSMDILYDIAKELDVDIRDLFVSTKVENPVERAKRLLNEALGILNDLK